MREYNSRIHRWFGKKVYDFTYEEKETDDTVIVTAKIVFDKKSKTAINKLEKAEKKNILPLTLFMKELESDLKRERLERERDMPYDLRQQWVIEHPKCLRCGSENTMETTPERTSFVCADCGCIIDKVKL